MSAIAQVLAARGNHVYGSDRSHDRGETPEKFARLRESGIRLCRQDGCGLTGDIDFLVVSSAVEESIPDVKAARALGIPVCKRAEILAGIVNEGAGIAVAGTSGKTTVTGMTGHILKSLGLDPTIINGGEMINYGSNAVSGQGDYIVAETDESDGSIALYKPAYAVLTNIALDHKGMDELRGLFGDFLERISAGAALNLDNEEAAQLQGRIKCRLISYGVDNDNADIRAENIILNADGACFDCLYDGSIIPVTLQVPGRHNVSNALAALALAALLGLDPKKAAQALSTFQGIKRRLQVIGKSGGITVIDDFAHNPDKIAASLQTLKAACAGRLFVIYQPHGFGPTQMLRDGLVRAFTDYLGTDDRLLMPEIYYAGGTAAKSVSSRDIITDVQRAGLSAHYFESRDEILPFLKERAQSGDIVAVMGARDDTLSTFSNEILKQF